MRYLISVLAVILILTSFFLFIYKDDTSINSNTQPNNSTTEPQTFEEFLIPVVQFNSELETLNSSEINQTEFISYEDINLELLSNISIRKIDSEKLFNLELEEGSVGLLSPENVNSEYKSLTIDKNNFWAKDFNPEKYPLKYLTQTKPEFNRSKLWNVFASGEIIPARAVDRLALNVNNNYTYLFDSFREDIESADLAITLLENSLLGDPKPCTGCMLFVSDEQVASGIAEVGFDLVSTAGNHAGDAGQAAYKNTLELFNQTNTLTTGTGNTVANASKPAIKEVNGIKVGMIGADDIASYYWKTNDNIDSYGTNRFSKLGPNGIEIDEIKIEQLKNIKKENNIDFLIIYMSWGIEYTSEANKHQQDMAKLFIANGVDLIVGSHPHWVQNVEIIDSKPVLYSLGNFIFDQTHTEPTRKGQVANIYIYDKQVKNIELTDHTICGYHQTNNNLTSKYLSGEISLEQLKTIPENQGCVYWMPIRD